MRDRIRRLREETLRAVPSISMERATLLTEFYKSDASAGSSVPVTRAMAFHYILANKKLFIGDGELIVGERGPAPAEVPTYPEICVHSLDDLDMLNSREKIPYKVDQEARTIHEQEIMGFWEGNAQRDRMFRELPDEWKAAYEAGVFTEFQEQRTPGHTALGNKIFKKGFLDLKLEIQQALEKLGPDDDTETAGRREELKAMDIAADALLMFAQRYADRLEQMAEQEEDADRERELNQMAKNCRRVPANAPETFREALQYYWFVHVGVITELNPWDAFNPGRLDQHLYPFFEQDIKTGALTDEDARELLQAFWVKFYNHPAPPKVGVTAQESATYTDFALINCGGLKEDGTDGVNDFSYLMLDVVEEMRMVQPSSMVQVSKKSPDKFLERVMRVVKSGFGQPSIFNTDAIVAELVRQGKSVEDARCGGASGCVESGAFGKEAYFLSGYFNIPKVLEITLNNGTDPRTGKRIGIETGDPCSFKDFDEFYAAFEKQLRHFVDIKINGNNIIEQLYAEHMPVPFLSLVIDDCIANGMDYHCGGARYNTTYVQGVGLGTVTDALTSVWFNVFDQERFTMQELLDALKANFVGHDKLRELVVESTPKYGNDDDRADDLAKRVFESYFAMIDGRPNAHGGCHRINMLPTTVHIYFGSVSGALPGGKMARETLSEGISPVQGADWKGPTAVFRSAGKIDHIKTGGTLLNQKFTPELLASDDDITKAAHLVRGYFRMDAHHVQFNVVKRETLIEAQKNPKKHRDLIVRVAGYSDYFINLTKELQDDIITRTEHQAH